jgi:hypothetical protein
MSVEEQNMPLTHTSEQGSCFRILWRPEQQLSSKKSLKLPLLLISMGDLSLSGLMRLRDRRSDWLLDQDKVIGCLLEQNSSSEILHRRKIGKIENLTASLTALIIGMIKTCAFVIEDIRADSIREIEKMISGSCCSKNTEHCPAVCGVKLMVCKM